MKNLILSSIILCLTVANANAKNSLPVNPASGEVTFKQTFTIGENLSEDQVFEVVQNWFAKSTSKFNRQNADMLSVGNGHNRQQVDASFSNARPLQSIDPSAKKFAAKGVIKYNGGAGSNINVLYMEYYMIIDINGNQVTATISNIKYHHFNSRTFAAQPIYSWAGGKPCDSCDKLESLLENDAYAADVNKLSAFLITDLHSLLTDLQQFVKAA